LRLWTNEDSYFYGLTKRKKSKKNNFLEVKQDYILVYYDHY